jgi:Flp pilus assembly protein TadG
MRIRSYRRTSGLAQLRSGRETGSTLVEYALVLIVFLTLVFGIIDFSRALYTYHFLSSAARDATRWAAVNGKTCNDDASCNGTNGMNNGPATTTQIQSYVSSHLPQAIDSAKLTTTVSQLNTNGPTICSAAVNGQGPFPNYPGCTVKVQLSYNFAFLTPIVGRTMTLSSTSQMVISH